MKRVDKIKCKFVNGIDNALASTYDHRALRIKDHWQKESCRSPMYNVPCVPERSYQNFDAILLKK